MITYGKASQDDAAIFRSSSSGMEYTPRRTVHFEKGVKDFPESEKSLQRVKSGGILTGDHVSRARQVKPASFANSDNLLDELGHSQVDPSTVGIVSSLIPSTNLEVFGGISIPGSKSGNRPIASELSPAESTFIEVPETAGSWKSSNRVSSPSVPTYEAEIVVHDPQGSSKFKELPGPQTKEPDGSVSDLSQPASTGFLKSPDLTLRPEEDSSLVTSLKKNYDDHEHDELSVVVSIPPPADAKPKPLNPQNSQQKVGKLHSDGLGSDEIAIGLPVEKYNPRPSRSRSGQANVDLFIPEDYSKRPETLTKKRKKNRRKTTAFERLRHDSEEEIDIFQVREPIVLINSPIKEKVALQELDNNLVSKTPIDSLPQLQDTEHVSKPLPSKKRGRPKKLVQEPMGESNQLKNQDDDLSEVPGHNSNTISSPTRPPHKKRKAPPDPSAYNASDSDSSPLSDEENETNSDQPRRDTTVENKKDLSTPHLPSPSSTNKSLSSPTKPPMPPPETPQKAVKGPDKHSPLNTGKLSHRVGLSKRARIEPLLKIVRK